MVVKLYKNNSYINQIWEECIGRVRHTDLCNNREDPVVKWIIGLDTKFPFRKGSAKLVEEFIKQRM